MGDVQGVDLDGANLCLIPKLKPVGIDVLGGIRLGLAGKDQLVTAHQSWVGPCLLDTNVPTVDNDLVAQIGAVFGIQDEVRGG